MLSEVLRSKSRFVTWQPLILDHRILCSVNEASGHQENKSFPNQVFCGWLPGVEEAQAKASNEQKDGCEGKLSFELRRRREYRMERGRATRCPFRVVTHVFERTLHKRSTVGVKYASRLRVTGQRLLSNREAKDKNDIVSSMRFGEL